MTTTDLETGRRVLAAEIERLLNVVLGSATYHRQSRQWLVGEDAMKFLPAAKDALQQVAALLDQQEALAQALRPFAEMAKNVEALVARDWYGDPKSWPDDLKHYNFDARQTVTVQQWLDLAATLAAGGGR